MGYYLQNYPHINLEKGIEDFREKIGNNIIIFSSIVASIHLTFQILSGKSYTNIDTFLWPIFLTLIIRWLGNKIKQDLLIKLSTYFFIIGLIYIATLNQQIYSYLPLTWYIWSTAILLSGILINPISVVLIYAIIMVDIQISSNTFDVTVDSLLTLLSVGFLTFVIYYLTLSIETLIKSLQEQSNEISEYYLAEKELLSELAHQIKTPLSSVKIDLHREGDCEEKSKRINNYINEIERSINRILKISRVNKSIIKPEVQKVDLTKFFNNIYQNILILAKSYQRDAKHISLNIDKSLNHEEIEISRDLIKECILNIVDNSFKHNKMRKVLKIEIKLERNQSSQVDISIRDNGFGLSSNKTNTKKSISYGLLISKNIVETHRGTISIADQHEKGTNIKITLPLLQSS